MYDVKFWETEDDRNTGNSYVDKSFSDVDEAIAHANKEFELMEYACVEVQDENGDVSLHLSNDECAYCDECGKEMGVVDFNANQGLCNCCIEAIN